jgi:hypothetical protein
MAQKIGRKTMDKIAVLIPCYNESKTIAKVVKILSVFYLMLLSMFTTTIQQMERLKSQRK